MEVKRLSASAVEVILAGKYRLFVGRCEESVSCHSILCHGVQDVINAIDRVQSQHAKLYATLPVAHIALSARPSAMITRCQLGERIPLPFGWTVRAVSNGLEIGGASWLFDRCSQTVLVACSMSMQPFLTIPAYIGKVDYLVTSLSDKTLGVADTFRTEMIDTVKEHSTALIALPEWDISGLVLVLEFIMRNVSNGPVVVIGRIFDKLIKSAHSLYEWLNDDRRIAVFDSLEEFPEFDGNIFAGWLSRNLIVATDPVTLSKPSRQPSVLIAAASLFDVSTNWLFANFTNINVKTIDASSQRIQTTSADDIKKLFPESTITTGSAHIPRSVTRTVRVCTGSTTKGILYCDLDGNPCLR